MNTVNDIMNKADKNGEHAYLTDYFAPVSTIETPMGIFEFNDVTTDDSVQYYYIIGLQAILLDLIIFSTQAKLIFKLDDGDILHKSKMQINPDDTIEKVKEQIQSWLASEGEEFVKKLNKYKE